MKHTETQLIRVRSLGQLSLLLALSAGTCAAQVWAPQSTFGTQGVHDYDSHVGDDVAYDHVMMPDGRLLLAGGGWWTGCNCNHITLGVIDTLCGKPDATFGGDGLVDHTFDQRSELWDAAVLPDGRILACGDNAPNENFSQIRAGIYRFNADGSPDLTFHSDGWRTLDVSGNSSVFGRNVFLLEGGGFYLGGLTQSNANGGTIGAFAARFLENGELDPGYGNAGIQFSPNSSYYWGMKGYTMLRTGPDELLWIGTGQTQSGANIHFTVFTDGEPIIYEPTTVAVPEWNSINLSAELLPDGRFLVSYKGLNEVLRVARFMPDRTLDLTYGNNGYSDMDPSAGVDMPTGFALTPDGGSVVIGQGPAGGFLLKRTADGQPDQAWGTNGVIMLPTALGQSWRGVVVLDAQRLMLLGSYTNVMRVVKYRNDAGYALFADLGEDVAACGSEPLLLDAGLPGSSYVWSTGATDQTITVDLPGNYGVTITTTDGCTDRDTVTVQLFTPPTTPQIAYDGVLLSTTAGGDLQWFLDGAPIKGATAPAWEPQENGQYAVMTTDENGCSATSAPFSIINVQVSPVARPSFRLAVHPMPVTDQSQLIIALDSPQRVTVSAHDALGRVVAELLSDRLLSAGEHRIPLQLPHSLASGEYLLRLNTQAGPHHVRLIK